MKVWSSIAFLLVTAWVTAQPYGDEWIEYDQEYFRIDVYETGIYRLDHASLLQAGIPLASISSEQFQLFGREEERSLYINDGGDGSIDPGDYLEFFGEKNNGWLDSLLYSDPSTMANPHYSLVNDTIHYFLTWNDDMSNTRVIPQTDIDFNNYLSPDFITRMVRDVRSSQYNFGKLLAFSNNIPDYVEGEGWMGARFGIGASFINQTMNLPTSNPFTGTAPTAIGKTVFASVNNANISGPNHHIRVFLGQGNAIQLADLTFEGYQLNTVPFSVPAGQMQGQTVINHTVVDDLDAPSDQFRVAYTELRYAHTKDVSDMPILDFWLASNPTQDKYHLDLSGVSMTDPIVYALGESDYRVDALVTDTDLDVLIPDQSGSSRIFIIDESQVIQAEIETAGNEGFFTDFTSLDPDSAFIIVYHPSLEAPAQTYAAYRTNAQQDAVLADIEQLYDQYGGGIPKHFLSIRRFCDMAIDTWQQRPGHLFLLGKSVFFEQQGTFAGARKEPSHYAQSLVPSFGSPGSDLLFTSGLDGPGVTPAIPTGRFSALAPDEVSAYLDKVVYNETRDPAAWMKNVLHFGGGTSQGEQAAFAGYLSNYEEIIEDTCYGGFVHTFLKESSLPIVVNLSDSISNIIEEGVSILTFFGHAGGGQFDQSIDEPVNLDWGAHPVVIVNSCFSGDIHKPGHLSTSEDYVILPEKGAVGFIASVQQGFEGYLNAYSTELYRQISQKNYGKSIGYLMQQTIDSLSNAGFNQDEARASLLMNLLEGDPAVSIFSPEKPDLYVDEGSISFEPQLISALVDSIEVTVVVTNIGKATNTPFEVTLTRIYPDGNEVPFGLTLDGLRFRDTLIFKVPTDFANGFGINQFRVQVDLPSNVIPELDNFFNNTVIKSLPITDGGVFPVAPYEFAIIPENQVTLKASTGNPFAEVLDYRIQLDTTDLFDSPLLEQVEISQSGGVLSWDVPLTLADSTVYYWRATEVEDDPLDFDWRESSFQYIANRSGWGQSHFFQFKDDRFNNLIYDRPEREFEFLSGTKLLSCEVYGNGFLTDQSSEYFIDFQSVDYNGCGVGGSQAFHVAVIDPVTLEPWGTRYDGENPDHFFGNLNDNGACRSRVEYFFIFRQNSEEQMEGFQNMLENEIPDGHIVLIYSWLFARPSWWPIYQPDMADILTDFGAVELAGIEENLPFITIGIKGDPSQTVEVIGDTITSYIELSFDMPVTGNAGNLSTGLIGPAQSWNALYWDGQEVGVTDSATISLIGLTPQGSEEPIAGGTFDISMEEVLDLDQLVDAQTYPYIRLRADLFDPAELDPIQLDRWQILYEPVPEAALNPSLAFGFHNDTIQEGEEIELITAIENISDLDMDSLLVRYWIETVNNEIIEIPYERQDSLRRSDVLIDTVRFSSFGLSGVNTLWVEANPINATTGEYDQLEQYHFNNLGQLRFQVNEDRINPILDVTFDGTHILDGDLISAKPEILIRLDDENPYLLMNDPMDTSYFSVFLTDPFGSQKRIYFNNGMGEEQMTFIPATGESNVADILFRPELEFDGVYRLLVTASDKSGNASGKVNYRIGFEVDHNTSITEVLNYPNPFTTSTRFVFTLTGVQVPDQMKIQIMTVTGKVVREIFKDELGDIRIGRNITDFAWDGTDMYGDRLANGVYLYRVIVKDNNEDVDVRATAASSFFKKGFGKMYLMR